jgi:hypothetical protein
MESNLFDDSVRFDVKTDNLNIKTTCYESIKIPDYKSNDDKRKNPGKKPEFHINLRNNV